MIEQESIFALTFENLLSVNLRRCQSPFFVYKTGVFETLNYLDIRVRQAFSNFPETFFIKNCISHPFRVVFQNRGVYRDIH